MPSNVFIYQLPRKDSLVEDDDLFIIEDPGTKCIAASSLRHYFYDYVVPSLSATEFVAASARIQVTDIQNYELSGFTIYGSLGINVKNPVVTMHLSATDAIIIPTGTTDERPTSTIAGQLRFNTVDNTFEGYNGTEWGALGETVQARFVDIGAGNINAGDTIPKGTSLQDLVNTMFTKTFYPTKIDPSASTGFSLASIVEAGTTGVTITITYDDGQILGKTIEPPGTWNPPSDVSGVWSPSTPQSNNYAGAVTLYTINGTANGTTNNLAFPGVQIIDGTNTFNSTVNFAQGPIPYDSKGGDYSIGLPRRSASFVNTTGSITGARKVWYGLNLTTINETNIRAYGTSKWSTSNTASIDTITITIPPGTTSVFFAYPADVTRTPVVIESVLNVDVFPAFVNTPATTVRGANSFTGTRSSYNVWRFVPATPFEQEVTYTITI